MIKLKKKSRPRTRIVGVCHVALGSSHFTLKASAALYKDFSMLPLEVSCAFPVLFISVPHSALPK